MSLFWVVVVKGERALVLTCGFRVVGKPTKTLGVCNSKITDGYVVAPAHRLVGRALGNDGNQKQVEITRSET